MFGDTAGEIYRYTRRMKEAGLLEFTSPECKDTPKTEPKNAENKKSDTIELKPAITYPGKLSTYLLLEAAKYYADKDSKRYLLVSSITLQFYREYETYIELKKNIPYEDLNSTVILSANNYLNHIFLPNFVGDYADQVHDLIKSVEEYCKVKDIKQMLQD